MYLGNTWKLGDQHYICFNSIVFLGNSQWAVIYSEEEVFCNINYDFETSVFNFHTLLNLMLW